MTRIRAEGLSSIVDYAGGMESHTLIPIYDLDPEVISWLDEHNIEVELDCDGDSDIPVICFDNDADAVVFYLEWIA